MMSLAPIEGLFRHRVLGMLRRKGLLTPERTRLMRSWDHSGFKVDAWVRIGADDATGHENLSLWVEPRPPPALPATPRAPVELEYLPSVE